jgi:hypothetical protein
MFLMLLLMAGSMGYSGADEGSVVCSSDLTSCAQAAWQERFNSAQATLNVSSVNTLLESVMKDSNCCYMKALHTVGTANTGLVSISMYLICSCAS